jgi:hypothetical protein
MNDKATLEAAPIEPVIEGQEAKPTDQVDVTPEPTPEESEKAEKAREHKRYQRRIDSITREKYQLQAELDAERRYNQRQPSETQNPAVDIDQIEQRILERYEHESDQRKLDSAFKEAKISKAEFIEANPALTGSDTAALVKEILESDVAPKLIKHFYDNPEEADRIAEMPVSKQIKEIGRLEMKLSTSPVVKKSGAPAPISPIGGKQSTNGLSDNSSIEDWVKERNKQLGHK